MQGYIDSEAKRGIVFLDDMLAYPYHSKIKKVARRFLIGRIPLPNRVVTLLLNGKRNEKSWLKEIHPGDVLLVGDVYNPKIFKAFSSVLPRGVKKNVYFTNPIDKDFKHPWQALNTFRKTGAYLWSFAPRDAEKYNLRMAGQFFFLPIGKNIGVGEKNSRQAFFCGLAKDRAEEIAQIKSFLQSHGIQCDFHIPIDSDRHLDFKQEYLPRLGQAGIVIDINQKGQTGLTRRPIEALLWNKKLVTNNKTIVDYDFYRPENVFIFGMDAPCRFEHFIETPLAEVPENIKSRYTVEGWLKQFS